MSTKTSYSVDGSFDIDGFDIDDMFVDGDQVATWMVVEGACNACGCDELDHQPDPTDPACNQIICTTCPNATSI